MVENCCEEITAKVKLNSRSSLSFDGIKRWPISKISSQHFVDLKREILESEGTAHIGADVSKSSLALDSFLTRNNLPF